MLDDTRRAQKELCSCNHRNSWIVVRYVPKPKGKYVNGMYRITALKMTIYISIENTEMWQAPKYEKNVIIRLKAF